MKKTEATRIGLVAAILLLSCDGPSVSVPVKPRPADTDDLDDESEEATYMKACRTDADCPGTENTVCSAMGCVECTSTADCKDGEACIIPWGDCEDLSRIR